VLACDAECARNGWDIFVIMARAAEWLRQTVSPAIEEVVAEMVKEKTAARRDPDYVKSLKQVAKMFMKGRQRLPMNLFTALEVNTFLDSKKLASRSTLRSRLATLFKYARRKKYRTDNPCAEIEPVKVLRNPPVIFTPAQTQTCLHFFKKKPRGLAWFILSTFAGLRPAEAMKAKRSLIHLDAEKPYVNVMAAICKTGQQRIVYLRPEVAKALRWALDHGAAMPIPLKYKTKMQRQLRKQLKLKRWPHDVTRHSACSYWIASTDDKAYVASMLGHSEKEQARSYKLPVPRTEAEKFYRTLEILIPQSRDSR